MAVSPDWGIQQYRAGEAFDDREKLERSEVGKKAPLPELEYNQIDAFFLSNRSDLFDQTTHPYPSRNFGLMGSLNVSIDEIPKIQGSFSKQQV
jgi:hypothetical protein